MTSLHDFLREQVGSNWVVARRTERIVRQYGSNVVCLSQQRYREIEREYRALYGDPYDKTRADLYLALRDMVSSFGHLSPQLKAQAYAALEAEATR